MGTEGQETEVPSRFHEQSPIKDLGQSILPSQSASTKTLNLL